ncbi:GspH/FimT family pseudopilin [Verminephrobacter eiseniae]|uniref:GspH/FimT family pseudopilin n=1 Tax=Verminephrobacter eiseniae TaxID=364317 RepID=UPI002237CFE3|nr:GspH/FimT family pseudopilin [Verminephrobacter eiseniae]MCW5237606.1 prepilin-type N-terminal cleavage/methylation domain-containing protein [Verminephrobacter eiseniae]
MTNRPSRAGAAKQGKSMQWQWLRKRFPKNRSCTAVTAARGFTLIELMVTLALAVILGSLAAPSVRDSIIRSRLTNLGNEFTGSIFKARSEAVNRNTCVTLCMSANAGDPQPTCSAASKPDWNKGWIIFLNDACDSPNPILTPELKDVLLARPATSADYKLRAGKIRMTFNARGGIWRSQLGQINLIYKEKEDPLTEKLAFNICVNGLGISRTIPSDRACADY